MRIVHILPGKARPDGMNGVNRVVHAMANQQVRQGHSVEVWGLSASMAAPSHPCEYLQRIFPVTRLRFTLGREIKAALAALEAGTWVEFHSVFIPEFTVIAGWLRKHGFLYGVCLHGGYAAGVLRQNPLKKRAYLLLHEQRYLRNAAWIYAVGASEIEDARLLAPGVRTVLIPHGQEPLALPVPDPTLQVERPLIGFCGRLEQHVKGLDFLIDGFSAYKSKGGRGTLWLIGDGQDRVRLEARAAHSPYPSLIQFLGASYGEQKYRLIAAMDVFVQASRWDVLPTGCLEAAALARPLIVSRETNMADYIQRNHAGLVLDETSAQGVERALAAVELIYQQGTLRQLGENARTMTVKDFSWEEHARSFIAAITACHPSL